tara:strand:+ start:20008 stop:20595 length:588 start_codon:yes stop_codon:yes gene_type:complete
VKLIDTFEILEMVLYSVVYDEQEYQGVNEFRRLLNQWTDRKYLIKYFKRNEKKLQTGFWNNVINSDPSKNVSMEQAVNRTIEEASKFEEEILKLANGSGGRSLEDIFTPLHKEIKLTSDKFEFKAYGIREKSWLRFYAIRLENQIYFIAGGGIKLTKKMQDSEGLDIELEKLKKVYFYLYQDPDVDSDLIEKLEG